MRAGREDGYGQVYDQNAQVLLYQDEHVVSTDKAFVTSNSPAAPFPVTETDLFLTNWRLIALGKPEAHVDVARVGEGMHQHMSVASTITACDFLEVYLDEVMEYKKSLLGELKLRMRVGMVEMTGLSKPFRSELLQALDWYLTPKR